MRQHLRRPARTRIEAAQLNRDIDKQSSDIVEYDAWLEKSAMV